MIGRRRGSMFLEMCVAVFVLAAALVAVAQLLAIAAQQQRALDQRLVATREAANLMEHLMVLPWDELSQSRASSLTLSAEAQRRLLKAELRLDVSQQDGPPITKRLVVQIGWQDRSGQRVEPLRLAAWRHRLVGGPSP